MGKKHLAAGFITLAMLSALPVTVSAHCGGHRYMAVPANVSCAICSVEGCTAEGRHIHDGVTYCSYAHADGICDGTCRALCTDESCTLSGWHSHDGSVYCGDCHENGFCDGSCQQVHATVIGGHHGRHGHC